MSYAKGGLLCLNLEHLSKISQRRNSSLCSHVARVLPSCSTHWLSALPLASVSHPSYLDSWPLFASEKHTQLRFLARQGNTEMSPGNIKMSII